MRLMETASRNDDAKGLRMAPVLLVLPVIVLMMSLYHMTI